MRGQAQWPVRDTVKHRAMKRNGTEKTQRRCLGTIQMHLLFSFNFKEITMNRSYLTAITLAVAALSAGQTLAADTDAPKTREQVRAELREAQRTGDIVSDGETGLKLNELYPHRYPAAAVAQGKTRATVQAELQAAQRSGDIVADGETGQKLNELYPNRYPATATAQGKTREQVRAELREAQRNGDVMANSESGQTLKDLNPGRYPVSSMN